MLWRRFLLSNRLFFGARWLRSDRSFCRDRRFGGQRWWRRLAPSFPLLDELDLSTVGGQLALCLHRGLGKPLRIFLGPSGKRNSDRPPNFFRLFDSPRM